MDDFFVSRAAEPDKSQAVLNCLGMQSGAVFSAAVNKGTDDYAIAVVNEALKFTGRARIMILCDQENSVNKLADILRDSRVYETPIINTPTGSSASAGGIERANYEVEKQVGTMRSSFEEAYGVTVDMGHEILPRLTRHAAWLVTHFQIKDGCKTLHARLRGRPYRQQVAEFGDVVHYRDPATPKERAKLDDRWALGVWLGKSMSSDEH